MCRWYIGQPTCPEICRDLGSKTTGARLEESHNALARSVVEGQSNNAVLFNDYSIITVLKIIYFFPGIEEPTLSKGAVTESLISSGQADSHPPDTAFLQETNTKTRNTRQASIGVPLEIFPYRFPEGDSKVEPSFPRSAGLPQVVSPRLSDAHLAYLLKLPHSNTALSSDHIHSSTAFPTLSAHMTSPFQPYDKRLSSSLAAASSQSSIFNHQSDSEQSLHSYFNPSTSSAIMDALGAQHQAGLSSSLSAFVLSRLSTNSRAQNSMTISPAVDSKRYLPPLKLNQDYGLESPFVVSSPQVEISENGHQRPLDGKRSSDRSTRSKDKQKLKLTCDTFLRSNSAGSMDLSKDGEISMTQNKSRRALKFGSTESNQSSPDKRKSLTGCESDSESSTVPKHIKDSEMYRIYNSWALKNYGDSGKTKTVTWNKYNRIVRILGGDESSASDNAKFKFWVKAKGFCLSSTKTVGVLAGVELCVSSWASVVVILCCDKMVWLNDVADVARSCVDDCS
ncbi:nucleolar protein 4 [Plakobranchus ocellatus]|uniref:Nucleolar protein 4 n=1 Tax=Plakobranchus ocellatus TaxID=259542 RepID=A0AAV4DV22_9GAST|nr:nucleolar protein 4 [Plakobranchus ocellatus]